MTGATDRIVLRPSRLGTTALLLGSAAFTAGGIWMLATGAPKGWFVTGFFGLCALIAALNALPGAAFLVLDAHGFEMRSLFRSQRFAWSDVAGFTVTTLPFKAMVAFVFTEEFRQGRARPRFRLAGIDGVLPNAYGQAPEDLADLLNDWKDGRRRPRPTPAAPRGPALVRVARGPAGLFVLHVLAILAFCGGPLRVMDGLEPALGKLGAFLPAIAPIALLLFGALALRGDERSPFDRWSIAAGRLGSCLLLAMDAWAGWQLWRGEVGAGHGTVAMGTVLGIPSALLYLWLSRRGS